MTTTYYLLLKRKERAGIFRQQYNEEVKKLLERKTNKKKLKALEAEKEKQSLDNTNRVVGIESPKTVDTPKDPKVPQCTPAEINSPAQTDLTAANICRTANPHNQPPPAPHNPNVTVIPKDNIQRSNN